MVPAAALVAVLAGALLWARPTRVLVEGTSMVPTLRPGDRLLVVRTARLRRGDVVAVTDPRRADRLLVKRVHAVDGAGVDVRGDNPQASTDSRQLGPMRAATIRGRVVYRYHPSDRVGRLGH